MCVWVSTSAGVVLLPAIPLVSAVSDLEGLVVRLPFVSLSGLGYRTGQVCFDAVLWLLMASQRTRIITPIGRCVSRLVLSSSKVTSMCF